VPIEAHLRVGPTAEALGAAAEELDASLVIVGTHGRTGIARAVLGSVADKILRTVHRPTLVVPPPLGG
jgi:nucleotide-binding universal stress UspA family protein